MNNVIYVLSGLKNQMPYGIDGVPNVLKICLSILTSCLVKLFCSPCQYQPASLAAEKVTALSLYLRKITALILQATVLELNFHIFIFGLEEFSTREHFVTLAVSLLPVPWMT